MLSTLIAAGSLVGLIISLLLLAWQTRAVARQTAEVARQTEIANAIAGSEVTHDTLASLREVLFQMIERPDLRAYVYDGKPCPRRGKARQQVLSFTEVLADTLNMGMRAHRWASPTAGLPCWPLYAWHMLQRSPTLQMLVWAWPAYWVELSELIDIETETEVHRYVMEHRGPPTDGLAAVPLPDQKALAELLSPPRFTAGRRRTWKTRSPEDAQ